ncbi:hypothetical protein GCM10007301_40060 [Azorhizobium oxalatiphilum]|uniref:Uncharacterized protein n=1 Tax=Azorhizobium oxalatiphilum TaxID=980631 RepID=A0A917FEK1_9HYPH|nr:hypothetical protein [Azorhizobium oxalatiphilum]GGF76050.1 hypothetical protein GCM10007301_40060 [Azorhizobium oxalatiphilum]
MWGRGLREVETVFLATFGQGARVVGVTGVLSDSGVSTMAGALAERSQRQSRTLLVGLADPTAAVPAQATTWGPEDPDLADHVITDARGFDRLTAAPTPEMSFAFRNASAIRNMLDGLLRTYDAIVLDLAPVEPRERVAIPVTAIASACESVIIVCLAGRVTKGSLNRAATALRQANAPLQGIVVNDRFNPTPGEEIADEAERFSNVAPGLVERIINAVRNSRLLNTKL